jgi:hypothetical protein
VQLINIAIFLTFHITLCTIFLQGSPDFEMEVVCDCGYIDMFRLEICGVDMASVSADNGEDDDVRNFVFYSL